jgi:Dolichyl-phosphate-mannose-protein mannosyltransferase
VNATVESDTTARGKWRVAEILRKSLPWVALVALAASMVATDPWFTFLDDETAIIDAATSPVMHTIHLFWTGAGQHEHPPLWDIAVHFWLKIGSRQIWLLRLPSIALYILGIVLLSRSAQKIGGRSASNALVWIAALWPFGFHFGRLAAWYSCCFALVALLTLAYLRFLESPGLKNSLFLFVAALLLVYSNYYGWAICGFLIIDFIARRYRDHRVSTKVIAVLIIGLLVAYLPLWRVFFGELRSTGHLGYSTVAKLAYGIFNFYSAFISESVAPWIWALSIPAIVAITTLMLLSWLFGSSDARAFLLYFVLLLFAMATLGIVGTKRLLFISDWLLLAVSVALANAQRKTVRVIIAASLIIVGSIGWFGILTRDYYSAPHFIEPWQTVAKGAKTELDAGAAIVSNSPSFFFYLTYLVTCSEGASCPSFTGMLPANLKRPRVYGVEQWPPPSHRQQSVLFVKGVNATFEQQTASTEDWLNAHCKLIRQDALLGDSGFALKSRFFPTFGQVPYRIQISKYGCENP